MKWEIKEGKLTNQFVFKNQLELAECLVQIAKHSDETSHHADMGIHYNNLAVSIFTHDADSLTDADYSLANVIDEYYASYTSTSSVSG